MILRYLEREGPPVGWIPEGKQPIDELVLDYLPVHSRLQTQFSLPEQVTDQKSNPPGMRSAQSCRLSPK